MVNTQETVNIESIDIILRNLKADPEYYNHGSSKKYEEWINEERF